MRSLKVIDASSCCGLSEGLNVTETAWCLGIGPEAVKTRLHRARSFLRKELHQRAGVVAAHAFPLHLAQCDRVVEATFRRIRFA